jgi:hypothetical protein
MGLKSPWSYTEQISEFGGGRKIHIAKFPGLLNALARRHVYTGTNYMQDPEKR